MDLCRSCGSTELELLLDFGDMPLAGGFLADHGAARDEKRYPLVIHVCGACGLIQITTPIDRDVLFQDYSFSASTVPGLVAHFARYADWLAERFVPRTVVEFGCNDGVLLGPLGERGIKAVGVDLSRNISELARARGFDVMTAGFAPDVARMLRDRLGPVDIVTGSNAFAHNADPSTILDAANIVLGPHGRLCLEMMYAGDLFSQLQWDTLYHEHLTFYGLGPLRILLNRNGFEVEHVERLSMHSGSLRVVAGRQGQVDPSPAVAELERSEEELGLDRVERWMDFGRRCKRSIDVVRTVIGELTSTHRIWAYGAAGRATMWVNACGMDYLEAVVDASPLRAGKLMPGTHTRIVSPDEFRQATDASVVFVTAWNYLEGIRKSESWYRGLWAVPLPTLAFS